MSHPQSAADAAGAHAAITAGLFDMFLAVTGLFFLLVLLFLAWALLRRREDRTGERPMAVTLGLWAVLITGGLFALTIGSFFADRSLARAGADSGPPLRIRITGQQWWWQVDYLHPDPSRRVRTANLLHLPVGRPVHVTLEADDVIHSFWVPDLAGKQDLIPGRSEDIDLLPTRTGRFRAQCAEFCGLQHAHMALDVIVERPADYARWYDKALQPAPVPATALQKKGFAVFMNGPCAGCHAISGTTAQGTIGPDLTGVASRMTLAAGTLPNRRALLRRWIADPQAVKPGNRMPAVPLRPDELDAVTAYLESLT